MPLNGKWLALKSFIDFAKEKRLVGFWYLVGLRKKMWRVSSWLLCFTSTNFQVLKKIFKNFHLNCWKFSSSCLIKISPFYSRYIAQFCFHREILFASIPRSLTNKNSLTKRRINKISSQLWRNWSMLSNNDVMNEIKINMHCSEHVNILLLSVECCFWKREKHAQEFSVQTSSIRENITSCFTLLSSVN